MSLEVNRKNEEKPSQSGNNPTDSSEYSPFTRREFLGSSLTAAVGGLTALSVPKSAAAARTAHSAGTGISAYQRVEMSKKALQGQLGELEKISSLGDGHAKHRAHPRHCVG